MLIEFLRLILVSLFYHIWINTSFWKFNFRMDPFNGFNQLLCCKLDVSLFGGLCRREFFPETGKDLFKVRMRHGHLLPL